MFVYTVLALTHDSNAQSLIHFIYYNLFPYNLHAHKFSQQINCHISNITSINFVATAVFFVVQFNLKLPVVERTICNDEYAVSDQVFQQNWIYLFYTNPQFYEDIYKNIYIV